MPGTSMGFRTAGQHMARKATWQVGYNTVHCMLFQTATTESAVTQRRINTRKRQHLQEWQREQTQGQEPEIVSLWICRLPGFRHFRVCCGAEMLLVQLCEMSTASLWWHPTRIIAPCCCRDLHRSVHELQAEASTQLQRYHC